ncbi:hypothetical protein CLF_107776 [Clonorchis sinensis]|uniref:Uncharacterized protein n=1 Tax=Clonorchis sinensis TaxID=79923 RepID=G7YQZ7_CLOSI|nr:hypothetical protein CLF_107776 [Clonorchis sinensis]
MPRTLVLSFRWVIMPTRSPDCMFFHIMSVQEKFFFLVCRCSECMGQRPRRNDSKAKLISESKVAILNIHAYDLSDEIRKGVVGDITSLYRQHAKCGVMRNPLVLTKHVHLQILRRSSKVSRKPSRAGSVSIFGPFQNSRMPVNMMGNNRPCINTRCSGRWRPRRRQRSEHETHLRLVPYGNLAFEGFPTFQTKQPTRFAVFSEYELNSSVIASLLLTDVCNLCGTPSNDFLIVRQGRSVIPSCCMASIADITQRVNNLRTGCAVCISEPCENRIKVGEVATFVRSSLVSRTVMVSAERCWIAQPKPVPSTTSSRKLLVSFYFLQNLSPNCENSGEEQPHITPADIVYQRSNIDKSPANCLRILSVMHSWSVSVCVSYHTGTLTSEIVGTSISIRIITHCTCVQVLRFRVLRRLAHATIGDRGGIIKKMDPKDEFEPPVVSQAQKTSNLPMFPDLPCVVLAVPPSAVVSELTRCTRCLTAYCVDSPTLHMEIRDYVQLTWQCAVDLAGDNGWVLRVKYVQPLATGAQTRVSVLSAINEQSSELSIKRNITGFLGGDCPSGYLQCVKLRNHKMRIAIKYSFVAMVSYINANVLVSPIRPMVPVVGEEYTWCKKQWSIVAGLQLHRWLGQQAYVLVPYCLGERRMARLRRLGTVGYLKVIVTTKMDDGLRQKRLIIFLCWKSGSALRKKHFDVESRKEGRRDRGLNREPPGPCDQAHPIQLPDHELPLVHMFTKQLGLDTFHDDGRLSYTGRERLLNFEFGSTKRAQLLFWWFRDYFQIQCRGKRVKKPVLPQVSHRHHGESTRSHRQPVKHEFRANCGVSLNNYEQNYGRMRRS